MNTAEHPHGVPAHRYNTDRKRWEYWNVWRGCWQVDKVNHYNGEGVMHSSMFRACSTDFFNRPVDTNCSDAVPSCTVLYSDTWAEPFNLRTV